MLVATQDITRACTKTQGFVGGGPRARGGPEGIWCVPVATSGRAAELVKGVHETGDAVIVVQDGEPAAVLVDATEFATLREHRRFLEAVRGGLAKVEAGRVLTTPEIKKSLEAEFGPIAWR